VEFSITLNTIFGLVGMNTIIGFIRLGAAFSTNGHFLIFSTPKAIWNAPTTNNGPASAMAFLG